MNSIEFLLKNELILQIKDDTIPKQNIHIELTTTRLCNGHCSYCFELNHLENKCLPIDEMNRQLELLKDLVENFDETKFNGILISFWGGEPFLNVDFILKVIDLTAKYKFISYYIYSNGTLFDKFFQLIRSENILKIINRLTIQLSYDGEPHNTIKRGNTRDAILKTYQLLLDNNINIAFKSTLTYDMFLHLPEIWKSFEVLHDTIDNNILYCPTIDTTQDNNSELTFEIWKKSLLTIAKYEFDFIKKTGHPLMTWFLYLNNKMTCNLNNSITIDIDGNIYPCHGCLYSKNKNDFNINNTKNIKSLYDVLKIYNHEPRTEKCINCDSIYCNVCHITTVDSKNFERDWLSSTAKAGCRCNYFREFTKIKCALDLALISH